ncbi:MAG: zinc-ribbon domain-containing protein [Ligilactobacillus murinus]|nr:zinc-ribbon domain-containing protein [Ligilactobacillus murinus]
MICPTCGYQNLPKDKFCQQCGLALPKTSRSKLPVVIIISFLFFTVIGTGIAYHFGVINNDPKYVKYDKLEPKDVTGTWKLVEETKKGLLDKSTRSFEITPSKVTYRVKSSKELQKINLSLRIVDKSSKLIVFANKDASNWLAFCLKKHKINGVERTVLALPVQDGEWAYFVREGK